MSDLYYCKGAREERTASLAKRQSHSKVPWSPMIRRSGGSDIKERKLLLENAMTNSTCTQPVEKAISKDDPNYGRPQQGTFTEARGQRAQIHVHKEMLELCEIIYMNGEEQEDGTTGILFGDLFRIYTRISDKVVGLLLRARKYRLVYFEPEMLFQGQNDEEPILLLQPMNQIYQHFNENNGFVLNS